MFLNKIFVFVISLLINKMKLQDEFFDIEITGIEPNAGPLFGETRVLVRIKDFQKRMEELYPKPIVNIY